MYESAFGLRADPFALAPDPQFLYESASHAVALATLKVSLENRRGLIVLTGTPGTGKTLVLRALVRHIGPRFRIALLSVSKVTFEELLSRTLRAFGVRTEGLDDTGLLDTLLSFLVQCAEDEVTAVLAIDEAQRLDDESLDNVRLLLNYDPPRCASLQVVLSGQPELEEHLRHPSLRSLDQRTAVRVHIAPLRRRECLAYVSHRLRCVGGSSGLFTTAAAGYLAHEAQRVPRRLNVLCHTALLFAFARGADRVTLSVACAAARDSRRRESGLLRWWPVAAAALATVAVSMLSGGTSGARSSASLAAVPESRQSHTVTAPGVATSPFISSSDSTRGGQVHEWASWESATCDATISPASDADKPVPTFSVERNATNRGYRMMRVPPNVGLGALARLVYGNDRPGTLARIQAVNPQITDVDRIQAGDTLRFPEVTHE